MKKKSASPWYARAWFSAVIAALAFAVVYVMLATAVTPEKYDLKAGQVSPITITATKDIVDTVTTDRKRELAAAAVQEQLSDDQSVRPEVVASMNSAFDRINQMRKSGMVTGSGDENDMQRVYEIVGPLEISADGVVALLAADDGTMHRLASATVGAADDRLEQGVREGQLPEAINKIMDEVGGGEISDSLIEVARAVVTYYIKPNVLVNVDATEALRQAARDEVEPDRYIMGQNVVRSGELISSAQYAVLESLGMIKDRSVDYMLYIGTGMLLILLTGMIVGYLLRFEASLARNVRQVALMAFIVIIHLTLALLIRELNVFIIPFSLAVMLVALLIKPRLALVLNVPLSIIIALISSASSGVVTADMMCVMFASIVSGSFCTVVIDKKPNRVGVMLAGVAAALANMATIFAVGLINKADISYVRNWAMWAGGNGLLSSVLCIGLQPALEWLFNLVTPTKLVELSNPNQPLLKRLLIEAPGTYHHSIIVANLSEAAANAINANGLLARVGAYYHDIGKLKRPLYFAENQMGDNPHDRTDPVVSTAILTAHPGDGVQMAQKHRIPQPVQDIIAQHHGDTPVVYFYDKAVKQNGGEPLNPDDFRYDGQKPQTAEAAIVMLADTVEAAVRTLPSTDTEKMNEFIGKLMRGKLDDGQLDESPLTFRDLSMIQQAFVTVLTGVFHERIEYPSIDIPEKGASSLPHLFPSPEVTEAASLTTESKSSHKNIKVKGGIKRRDD